MSSAWGILLVYLAVHILAHNLSGLVNHFHHILAFMMVLLCSGSLSPMPPLILGLHTVSHFTNAHLRLVAELPHRKSRCRFLNLFNTHFGAARIEKR